MAKLKAKEKVEYTLQGLVNDHAKLMHDLEEKATTLTPEAINELVKEEIAFPTDKNVPEELLKQFQEYKKVCHYEYRTKMESLINFFQAKEFDIDAVKKTLGLVTENESSDNVLLQIVENDLFQEFFKQEEEITNFLAKNEIDLPQNLHEVFNHCGQFVQEEYDTWKEAKSSPKLKM